MAVSYEDIVQGAYGSIGRTGIGTGAGTIDQEGYNFWLNALKEGAVTPDQLLANFNQAVAGTIQQQPQAANSQAVAAYIEANPLATQIDPKKVVAVGDSTTWGYNQGNQVAENMVTTAQKALGSDYSVSNLGINSTTAGDFLNSSDFDKALSSGAGTVVLNYGMNEAYRNEDPATFAKNLLTAVQTLQAVGKKVILQTPNSTSSTDAWAQNVGAYADVVRSVSQQTGSTLDDKFTYTSNLTNATSAADPIHPTATTYGLLGNNLADAIKTTTTGVAPKAISVTPPVAAAQAPSLVANQAAAPVNPTVKLFQDTLGRTPTQEEIDNWNFGSTIDAGELNSFLGAARNEAVNTKPTTGAVANIAKQILAQGTTSQWGGEGYGSAEKNAYDMAVMLAGQGITDINQFGKATIEVPTYGTDDYGNQIETGTQTVTQFVNKATGEPINSYYDKAGGNVWGGTFAGKGSTAYGVQFDAAGKPIFYTQYGGSSNDLFNLLSENPVLNLGANVVAGVFGGPLAVGALQAAQGKDFNDVAKATLLSYLGQQAGQYFGANAPIDASNMNPAQFSDALETQLITEMQRSGLTNAQITQFLENASPADIASITNALPVIGASDNLLIEATKTPITADALIKTLAQVPTVAVTAKAPEKVSPDVLSAVTSIMGGATTTPPTVEIKDTRPVKQDTPVPIPLLTSPSVANPPTLISPTVTPATGTPPEKDLTTSDKLRIAQLGLTGVGLLSAGSALSGGGSGATQYPIVDVPANWATPPKTSVAPATVLPPINFGDRNLLIGTQWEKFLDPNYGQVPEPIQYSRPSSMSYNDLMSILGSKQGMPSASNLSINDIISGIQNQYGQARTGAMG